MSRRPSALIGRDESSLDAGEAEPVRVVDAERDVGLAGGWKVDLVDRRAGRGRVDAHRDRARMIGVGDVDDAVAIEVLDHDSGRVGAIDEGHHLTFGEAQLVAGDLHEIAKARADVIGGDEVEQAVAVEITGLGVADLKAELRAACAAVLDVVREIVRGRLQGHLALLAVARVGVVPARADEGQHETETERGEARPGQHSMSGQHGAYIAE